MRRFICTILLLNLFNVVIAQDSIKKYVQQNLSNIIEINPDSVLGSDLDVIGKAIGDSKIVMLGEQDHGDAPTFLAKTRLIRYLHEKMGFNVLAFEGDFFSLNYWWNSVKSGKLSLDSFIKKNISPMWTGCSTCDKLFNKYLPNYLGSQNPLEITGFDNHMNTLVLLPILDSVMKLLEIPLTQSPEYDSVIFPKITSWYRNTHDSIENQKVVNYLLTIKDQLLQKLNKDNFWILCVDNLIAENKEFNNWKKDYWKDSNTRDRQMGLNLLWLNDVKFPKEKIIVWAHNYHISKYAGHFPEAFLNRSVTMGSIVTANSEIEHKTYVLGFTSFSGTAGRLFYGKNYKLPKPEKNSFERWINKDYDYGFVDFKPYNQDNKNRDELFYMTGSITGNMLHSSHLGIWNKIFDGVFFIRNMYPCEDNR